MGHKHRNHINEIKKSNRFWLNKKHVYDPMPKYAGDPYFMLEMCDLKDFQIKLNTGSKNAK